jgi:hypothetical protein
VCVSTQHKQCLGWSQNTIVILLTGARHIADEGNRELQLSPHTQNLGHLGHTQAPTVPKQNKNTKKIGYITISPKIK